MGIELKMIYLLESFHFELENNLDNIFFYTNSVVRLL